MRQKPNQAALVAVELTAGEMNQLRVALLARQAQLALDYGLTDSRLIERQFRAVMSLIGKLFGPKNVNAKQNEVEK